MKKKDVLKKALYDVVESVDLIESPTREDLDFLNMTGRKTLWKQGFKGESVKVAIIDTGVNWNHPEFEGKTVEHYANCGYISDGMDDNSHGTHCAASICGNTVGVAPKATLVSYKVLDNFGWLNDVEDVLWAMREINNRNDIDVVSMSIGISRAVFSDSQLQEFHSLIDSLSNKGCHVVCSAGNQGDNSTEKYPAYFDNPIVIGATDENTEPTWFSSVHDEVDFCQVGYEVCSAWFEQENNKWWYKKMSGTSMATPLVAGMVALVCQKYKALYERKITDAELFGYMNLASIDLSVTGIDDKTGVGFFTFKDSLSVIEFDISTVDVVYMPIQMGAITVNGEQKQTEIKPFIVRDTNLGLSKAVVELRALFEEMDSTVKYTHGVPSAHIEIRR